MAAQKGFEAGAGVAPCLEQLLGKTPDWGMAWQPRIVGVVALHKAVVAGRKRNLECGKQFDTAPRKWAEEIKINGNHVFSLLEPPNANRYLGNTAKLRAASEA